MATAAAQNPRDWKLANQEAPTDRYHSSDVQTNDDSQASATAPNAQFSNNITTHEDHDNAQDPVSELGHDPRHGLEMATGYGQLEIFCGPLLNFKGTNYNADGASAVWEGSVLIVVKPGCPRPKLDVRCNGPIDRDASPADLSNGINGHEAAAAPQTNGSDPNGYSSTWSDQAPSDSASTSPRTVEGELLYCDPAKAFWRFSLTLPMFPHESRWSYTIREATFNYPKPPPTSIKPTKTFVIPSITQSFRVMFHSCNGFSLGTNMEIWSRTTLWEDVLRVHEQKPFHVMLGGGDQIYNDNVRSKGPLKEWTAIANPKSRRDYPFSEELREECDNFYYNNYLDWFTTGAFAEANGQIPQVNIWDDHDIIDGFGSYTDHFMKCFVFRGIGGVAHKHYMLFQHHTQPPVSTFTTDEPKTMRSRRLHLRHHHEPTPHSRGTGPDPEQLKDTYVLVPSAKDEHRSWIIGARPGPYVAERSRSLYMRLGARMALLGIDARTERTRHQVNYEDTYDLIFSRLTAELSNPGPEKPTHLLLLLGIPIAYPRLIWLENIFTSPLLAPLRLLNKRFGVGGDFFNNFDGSVDLLDDLDDHYTARSHKHERKVLMLKLQELAARFEIRITILGGDVHLAALGRFYSNPKLGLASEEDPRYMVNVISSAITNHPPPTAVANLLSRRNKVHHLDPHTDETLLNFFDKAPGDVVVSGSGSSIEISKRPRRRRRNNLATMPARNYAIITESSEFPTEGTVETGRASECTGKDGHGPLHRGEESPGTVHPSASGLAGSHVFGKRGLEVSIMVEKSPGMGGEIDGCQGYGMCSELSSVAPISCMNIELMQSDSSSTHSNDEDDGGRRRSRTRYPSRC